MDKPIEQDPSTAGMVQAAAQAEEKWQKEIDRALANLKEEMAPEQWTALQASQQPWRAYHEKELKAQDALYEAMDGSMWRVAAASKAMDLKRERACCCGITSRHFPKASAVESLGASSRRKHAKVCSFQIRLRSVFSCHER